MVRGEKEADHDAVFEINRLAYGRDAEGTLVNTIRKTKSYEKGFSLVAEKEGAVLGHVLFSKGFITHRGRRFKCLVLGPAAVRPEHQRRGIGTAIINEGLERAREVGFGAVVVVGDPVYFSRFGFVPALTKKLRTSLRVPDENFMVKEVSRNALRGIIGTVMFPREYLTLAEADRKREEERSAQTADGILNENTGENSLQQTVEPENFSEDAARTEINDGNDNPDLSVNDETIDPETGNGGDDSAPDNNIVM